MSRNYAQFSTAIWRPEDDFGELSLSAQWCYFMLGTQPDISAAGVLSLNVRRWSKRARGVTRDVVVEALQELQAAGKVFYDYDTEELLIRAFVKADGGYGNRKRQPVIERAALELESPRLRGILAAELRKLGHPTMTKLADRLSAPYGMGYPPEAPQDASRASEVASTTPASKPTKTDSPQVDSLSDSPYRFDGVVVTKGLVEEPQPTTHNPQPIPPTAVPRGQLAIEGIPAPPPAPPPSDAQRAFALGRYWLKTREANGTPVVVKGKADPIVLLRNLIQPFVENHYTDDEIKAALNAIGESIPSTARLDRTLTRIRGTQTRQGGYPPGYNAPIALRDTNSSRPSTATQRMQQALQVAAELDAEYGNGAAT
jgi:hypothetical protein